MTTELGPYLGREVGFPIPQQGLLIEGEFRELPEEEPAVLEEELWDFPEEEPLEVGASRRQKPGVAEEIEKLRKTLGGRQELRSSIEEQKMETALEELKSERRKFKRQYKPDVGKRFLKTYKGILGPARSVPRDFYIPRAMKEYYVPGSRVRALTTPPTQGSPIAEINRPQLGMLQRASAPPPSTPVRAPFRDVERQEGLGPALGRLRSLGKFPKVDWAVYSEVHANGDIDTPSHIRSEVGQLGFSRKEIDGSLKRLRDLGLIVPSGQVSNGEKELMITEGANGN